MKKALVLLIVLGLVGYFFSPWLLTRAGQFLVVEDDPLNSADAIVVLTTGVDYLPRLMQAADLYHAKVADKIVINGNRKTDAHRRLEQRGYLGAHPWYDGSVSVLQFLKVKSKDIVVVDAPDVYDTVSEAKRVGAVLLNSGLKKLVITTSKFHTRRANSIWRYLYPEKFELQIVSAKEDPFAVDGWWKDGRQIRQLLAEYGAWLFLWGKQVNSKA